MAGNDNELGQVTLHEYFTAPFKVVHKTQFKRCHTLNRCNVVCIHETITKQFYKNSN